MAHAGCTLVAQTSAFFRRNREITAPTVNVMGPDGRSRGIVSLTVAMKLAAHFGMDLVEVAPNAAPPVVCVFGITMCVRQCKEDDPPEDPRN
jgi:translation initiation factor IF-3